MVASKLTTWSIDNRGELTGDPTYRGAGTVSFS